MRLIDADALKKEYIEKFWKALEGNGNFDAIGTMTKIINEAPTVEAYTDEQVKELVDLNKKLSEERPHGEWLKLDLPLLGHTYKCSRCGWTIKANDREADMYYHFCNN